MENEQEDQREEGEKAPDVYARRRALLGLSSGKEVSESDLRALFEVPENYGDLEQMERKDRALSHVKANYNGKENVYFVPEAWGSGGRIDVPKAYLIVSEDEKMMNVREVLEPSELDSIAQGVMDEIRRKLGR
tara:strand:- start:414 stop:812 length:399 start_codon:yes stop_codon:yes gene_type:complete